MIHRLEFFISAALGSDPLLVDDRLPKRRLAFPLELLHVVDQTLVTVHLVLFLLLLLFEPFLLLVLLVDDLVYLGDIGGRFVALLDALVELRAQPCGNLYLAWVQQVHVSAVHYLILTRVPVGGDPSLLHALSGIHMQRLERLVAHQLFLKQL